MNSLNSVLFLLCVWISSNVKFNEGIVVVETQQQSSSHPCDRMCVDGHEPMDCSFTFNVEWHYTMGKVCGNCKLNGTGCDNADCIPADGRLRGVMVVNHMMPGPMIKVCRNDNVIVKVINNLSGDESITIHWHGMFMADTQYMDGANMITQCPINRGSSFTYKFKADPPGTHWWHAHSGVHRGEGINGALIVNQPLEVNAEEYDTDWSTEMAVQRLRKFYEAGILFYGDSLLINGLGYADENSGFRNSFTVTPGQRHRFRVISNTVTFCPIEITVDQHTLRVISLDGADIVPYDVTNLMVRSAETVDFVINADQPASNYRFRFTGSVECPLTHYDYLNYDIISKDIKPTSTPWDPSSDEYKQLNPLNMHEDEKHVYITSMQPKFSDAFPEDDRLNDVSDEVHYIGVDIINKVQVEFNNVTNKHGSSPLLSQPENIDALCNPENHDLDITPFCNEKGVCTCNHIIDVELGKLVDLVLYDQSRIHRMGGHIIHLHGHHFSVVKMDKVLTGRLYVTEVRKIYNEIKTTLNGSAAVRKDTVALSASGYTVVRFVADKPGVWLLHCHYGLHSMDGMALSIRVGYPDDIPPPPKNFPKCGSWKEEAHDSGMK